jgi:hypothetical protein
MRVVLSVLPSRDISSGPDCKNDNSMAHDLPRTDDAYSFELQIPYSVESED